MRELPQTEAEDIAKQFDGNSWIELVDIQIPWKYEPFLHDYDEEWMSVDPDGQYHILMTNSGITVAQAVAGWDSLGYENQRIFWEVPYRRDEITEADDNFGEVATKISLGDAAQMLMDLMERLDGMISFKVTLSQAMVNPDSTATIQGLVDGQYVVANESVLDRNFLVGTTTHDRTNFTITLETALPMAWRYPYRTIIKSVCQWVFKSPECGYSGEDGSCGHTIKDCKLKGNIVRFGAFPGCGDGGLGRW